MSETSARSAVDAELKRLERRIDELVATIGQVKDALRALMREESARLIDMERVVQDALRRTEQAGIIFLDEIDKIAGREAGTRDVSGRGVQTNLLKLMEDADVPVMSPNEVPPPGAPRPRENSINTRHILFIVSGAFAGLESLVRHREAGSALA